LQISEGRRGEERRGEERNPEIGSGWVERRFDSKNWGCSSLLIITNLLPLFFFFFLINKPTQQNACIAGWVFYFLAEWSSKFLFSFLGTKSDSYYEHSCKI
jgi:hypothetical protein